MRRFRSAITYGAVFLPLTAFLSLTAAAPVALADGEVVQPTFFLDIDGGYSVYKSTLVQSNDTGITTRYAFGVNAGANHQIGMLLARESSTIAFKNTASQVAMSWQDVDLRYHFGYIYFGLVVSSTSWAVKEPPQVDGKIDASGTSADYLDVLGSGYGANVGLQLPAGKRNSLYADLTYATTGSVQQKAAGPNGTAAQQAAAARVTTIGPRMEVDLGASIGLTKSLLDALVGFKYRSYALTVDGTTYKEQLNTTYIGLRTIVNF